MKHYLERALNSSFLRSITVLATGNVMAQIIPILMLPFFTRMYDASLFGIQALLMIGITFMVPLSTGFYEYAIPTPRSLRHARGLATIAFTLSASLNSFFTLVLFFAHEDVIALFHIEDIGNWVFAYPIVAFSASMMSLSNYWLLRRGKFYLQSVNKLCQSSSTAIFVMILGLAHVSSGLTAGFVGGVIMTGVYAIYQARRQGMRFDYRSSRVYFVRLMRKYMEFPIFGSLPSSINNLATQVPIIIITANYSLQVTGHYSVARNLLNGGVSLLSVCIGQVILKHFADLTHKRIPLWPHYCRIAGWILLFGCLVSAGFFLLGPWFFRLYLGPNWGDSAEIVRIISLNMLFWLLGPSLALAAIAIKKLRAIALWQVLHGTMAFGLVLFSKLPFHDFIWRVVIYEAFSYCLYFIIMTITVWRYDHHQKTA